MGGVNGQPQPSRQAKAIVNSIALAPQGRPMATMAWGTHAPRFPALYDTGANPNCLRRDAFAEAKAAGAVLRPLPRDAVDISSASRHTIVNDGTFMVRCVVMGRLADLPFVVCSKLASKVILGAQAAQQLGLGYNPIDNTVIFFKQTDGSPNPKATLSVCAAKAVTLLPGQATRVELAVACDATPTPATEFISTIQDLSFIAKTNQDARAQVVLVNTTACPVPIPRGALLAIGTPLPPRQQRGQPTRARRPRENRPLTPEVARAIDDAVRHLPAYRAHPLRQLLLRFQDVISRDKFDLGRCDLLTHRITLTEDTPVFRKQFPIPSAHISVIREHVEAWLRHGIIEPARSEFNSAIFCVPKKDGGFRLCLDYRALNAASLPTNYSIRTVEDCLSEIGASKSDTFCALDLSSGFYHMPLHPMSKKYTAFTVPGLGQFQWRVGAMGLTGCPGSFARLMDMAMSGLPNTLTYLDDILIHGRGDAATLQALSRALHRLRVHDLRLNLSKSRFLHEHTPYLGHSLSAHGVRPGPDKAQALRETQPPTTPRQVRSFLGLANFFRSYVRCFSARASPLYALTRPNGTWKGGPLNDDALQAFKDIREAICHAAAEPSPTPTDPSTSS
jgi:hypothetical protein